MFVVASYAAVRRYVFVEGHNRREAAREFGLSRETVSKMCRFSLPPGYITWMPDNELLVLERGSATTKLYRVRLDPGLCCGGSQFDEIDIDVTWQCEDGD
jgi:hypothetical protein